MIMFSYAKHGRGKKNGAGTYLIKMIIQTYMYAIFSSCNNEIIMFRFSHLSSRASSRVETSCLPFSYVVAQFQAYIIFLLYHKHSHPPDNLIFCA